MSGKTFIDTNIFIYSLDSRDGRKQEIARKVLRSVENGVISTQVMQEFYAVMTRKLNVAPLEARKIVQTMERFEIVPTSPKLIYEAINVHILEQIQFWDAMIIVGGNFTNCTQLLSEDFNTGQIISGIEIINPFLLQ
jgi:predicted nucleic acid-binding protein